MQQFEKQNVALLVTKQTIIIKDITNVQCHLTVTAANVAISQTIQHYILMHVHLGFGGNMALIHLVHIIRPNTANMLCLMEIYNLMSVNYNKTGRIPSK